VNCKRKNAAVGRNAGAKAAKGDVFVFMDADTIAFSNLLNEIQKDFEKGNVVGWTCKVFAFSPKFKEHLVYNFFNDLMKFLNNRLKKPHASGMAIAVRRDAFEKVNGFNEDLKTMEDHDMAKRLGKIGVFKFSDKTCVFTSTRRFSKWGGWKLLKVYSKAYYRYLTNRECVKSYSPIR
jgi:glycosyltransferase involved in cell wall biosynthesis